MKSDLLGLAEVATVLGVTKATAARRVREEGFPEPVTVLEQGPLWSGRQIVDWHAAGTLASFHSQLSPFGPIPSKYARHVLSIRVTIEAQWGREMERRLAYCSVGDDYERLLGLDLLQCLEWMESPVWAPPGGPRPDDHWAKIPATAKARWRKAAELSIGVGTAPGVPATYLIGHVGTDSDWNEDNWGRATWTAQELIKEAGKRAKRDLTAFYPGGTWVAAMRDLTDETVFYVGGAGEPHEVSMPSEEDTMNHVWGRS